MSPRNSAQLEDPQVQLSRLATEEFPLLAFPTKSGEWWLLHESGFEELRECFPYMTPKLIGEELILAFAWIKVNQKRRKTERGMMKFLVNWIARSRRDD